MVSLCSKIEGLNAAAENHLDNDQIHEEILENGKLNISTLASLNEMKINVNNTELFNDSMISLSESN